MLKKLRAFLSGRLLHSFLSLFGVQVTYSISSLILIPYLTRTLGPDIWGVYVLAQAIGTLILPVVEYGFEFTATREVTQCLDDQVQQGKIASMVFLIQVPLTIIAFAASFGAMRFVPGLGGQDIYVFFAVISMNAAAIAPWWYFQAIERLRQVAAITIGIRFVVVVLTFVLVNEPSEGWIVLALEAGGNMLITALMIGILYYRHISLEPVRVVQIWDFLTRVRYMALYKVYSTAYANVGVYIVGVYSIPAVAGYFGAAEKLIKAGRQVVRTATRVLYPRISILVQENYSKAVDTRDTVVRLSIISSLSVAVLTTFLAEDIVRLILGTEYLEATVILKVLIWSIPGYALTDAYGTQWLLAIGKDQIYVRIIVVAGLVLATLSVLIVPTYGGVGMASVIVGVELLTATALYGCVRWVSEATHTSR